MRISLRTVLSDRKWNKAVSIDQQIIRYAVIFLFYFANYFFITFFNTAIVACAISRMAVRIGDQPSSKRGRRSSLM